MKKNGFTLIELMITIAIIGITVLVFGTALIGGCIGPDWQQAESHAKDYARKVPGSTGEVSCMKKDSDGDGYCRCNIFMKNMPPVNVECGCERFCFRCAEGCGGIKAHAARAER